MPIADLFRNHPAPDGLERRQARDDLNASVLDARTAEREVIAAALRWNVARTADDLHAAEMALAVATHKLGAAYYAGLRASNLLGTAAASDLLERVVAGR